ncbi:GNAT family N-acetyltransferase [Yinghuangia sp. ASG 101]|uniref:GNAT family N-acetyltransferase n=1 Tax=Yinghuangia sp. ASG 101 TaxID=2896848 RepID=UPI001E566ECC|nr:GNAT family N-acetyltransferase [Yinghuangia sp. ASG 101]UGQ10592.1 GNAT family N-acetyltransferase [Yinghuangia sp. ASG 101]
MNARGVFLHARDLDTDFTAGWDRLVAARGVYADCFDTYTWAASVMHADPVAARRIRIAAVLDEPTGKPVSLLALEDLDGRGRFASFAEDRPRSRVVAERASHDELGALADQLAASGVRDLRLRRMPSRDPATHRLLGALRRAGYRVHARERSSDMLADVTDGWAGHRARFASFHAQARRLHRKLARRGDVALTAYTRPGEADTGFAAYAALFPRSWKGPLTERTRTERRELVRRTAENGWLRLYVLRVDGRPAATYLWFRVGAVALWHSTAYDEEFAGLGVGNLAMWQAHEHILVADPTDPPTLVDLLPTTTSQKLRLAPERPPLLDIEAVRDRPLTAAALPVRALARTARASAAGRIRARRRGRTTASTGGTKA